MTTPIEKQVFCISCGTPQNQENKFCYICGQTMNEYMPGKAATIFEHVENTQTDANGKHLRLKNISIVIISAVITVVIGLGVYFLFFNTSIKKTLIASISIMPNDSTETVIRHGDDIALIIPKGQIKNPDILDLYSVKNIDKPEFAENVIKTFDFDFRKTKSFSEEIEMVFSFEEELKQGKIKSGQGIHIMYYNEKTEQWENSDANIDWVKKTITVNTKHFSCWGMVTHMTKPGPLMELYEMKRPSTLSSKPDVEKSKKFLEDYDNLQTPSAEAVKNGGDLFIEAFSLTSTVPGFLQEVAGATFFEKFNSFAGECGLAFALWQYSWEIWEGKDEQAKKNMSKNLMLYSLGKWGWDGLRIANIGIFFIDYSLNALGNKANMISEEKWTNKYNEFNLRNNKYRKTQKQWKEFILKCIDEKRDIQQSIDNATYLYLHECFNDPEGGLIPVRYEESLINQEKTRVYKIIRPAVEEARAELEKKRQNEILGYFAEMKKLMNSKIQIRIIVYGEKEGSKRVRDLPVRINVKKNQNDQHLWEVKTDHAGQCVINCTWYGYMYYGKPTIAELDYKGQKLQQEFKVDASNSAVVRFYLPQEKEEDGDGFDFSGTYKGTYTSGGGPDNPECKITGTVEIKIDASGNTRLVANGSGGCKYPTWSSKETQKLELKRKNENEIYYNKEKDMYYITLKGSETKTTTNINKFKTETKNYSWERGETLQVFRDGTIKDNSPKSFYFKLINVKKVN